MRRLLVLVLAAAAALAGGCSRVVPGVPTAAGSPAASATPTPTVRPTPTRTPTPSPTPAGPRGCTVVLTRTNYEVTSVGASVEVRSSDDGTFVVCGGGPSVRVQYDADEVILTLDGAESEIAAGEEGVTVGPYGVDVDEVSPDGATFTLLLVG